jgi:hypothetical protein
METETTSLHPVSGADRTAGVADRTAGGGDRVDGGTDRTARGAQKTAGGGDRTADGTERTTDGLDRTAEGTDRTADSSGKMVTSIEKTASTTERSAGATDKTANSTVRNCNGIIRAAVSMDIAPGSGHHLAAGNQAYSLTSLNKPCDSCFVDCDNADRKEVETVVGTAVGTDESSRLVGTAGSWMELAEDSDIPPKGIADGLGRSSDSCDRAADCFNWLDQDSQSLPLLRANGSAAGAGEQLSQQQLAGCRSVNCLPNCDNLNGSCQRLQLLSEDSSSDIILV